MLFSPWGKAQVQFSGSRLLFTVFLEENQKCDSEGADVLFKVPLEENQMCDLTL